MSKIQELIETIDGDHNRLLANIALTDDLVALYDGTPQGKRVILDNQFGDAIGKAVKPLLLPYFLKRIFTRQSNRRML